MKIVRSRLTHRLLSQAERDKFVHRVVNFVHFRCLEAIAW
jgi:hypothetical protein